MKIAYQIVHVVLSDFAIHAVRYTFFFVFSSLLFYFKKLYYME